MKYLRLLDITAGRANRLQFLVFAMIAFSLSMIAQNVPYSSLENILTWIAFYFLTLGMVRRFRDTGYDYFAFLIALVIIPFCIIYAGLLPVLVVSVMEPQFGSVLINTLLALIFGYLVFQIFRPGSPEPNLHGLSPIGLDFRTMIPETFPNFEAKEKEYYEKKNQMEEDRINKKIRKKEEEQRVNQDYERLIANARFNQGKKKAEKDTETEEILLSNQIEFSGRTG